MRDRPHISPETGWVIAHDVFHHQPGDTGTYAEEVMTFGAEAWLDSSSFDAQRRSLITSWFSVMALVVENGTRGVEGLLLSEKVPPDGAHPHIDFFSQVYQDALSELKESFEAFAELDTWEQLQSPGMVARAASLATKGYDLAQNRWPDPVEAHASFKALEAMASPGVAGETLHIEQNGSRLRMERTLVTPKRRSVPGR